MNDGYFRDWFTEEQREYRELQLSVLSKIFGRKNGLTFKGGTALDMFYGSGRFSEDLDFDCEDKESLSAIDDALEAMGKEGKYIIYNDWGSEREVHSRFIRYSIRISSQDWKEVVRLTIDYTVDRPKYAAERMPMKWDNSITGINVMQAKEILAEKVSAIMSRSKARDLYDLYFLVVKKKVQIRIKDVYEKCGKSFDAKDTIGYSFKAFERRVGILEGRWRELDPLLQNPKAYAFKEVSGSVLDAFRLL